MSADALNDACLAAASTLPEGYSIEIYLENGYGGVTLFDPDGNGRCFEECDSLSSRVRDAVKFAIEQPTEEKP